MTLVDFLRRGGRLLSKAAAEVDVVLCVKKPPLQHHYWWIVDTSEFASVFEGYPNS